jgi:antitoxin Phd
MRTVSESEAKLRFSSLLADAQKEPVVIRSDERDVAVLLSAAEYERMRSLNIEELQRFCDRVAAGARDQGMDETVLHDLLNG